MPVHQTAEVNINELQLKTAMRHDPETFMQFFLFNELTRPIPEFHKDVFREMTHSDVKRLVIAIPRGHNKTTLAKLTAAWYLIFSDFRFVLYVSGSHDLVVPYVNDIASFFESENFIALFGPVEWIKKQDGAGIYQFRIPSLGKMCILRGLGLNQRVKGINVDNVRPQLALIDDLEDYEDVETDAMHAKVSRWWFGQFIKCLDKFNNKIIMSGNLIAKKSILYKMLQSARWRSYLYGCIRENGIPLWEDMWPMEDLRADYLEYVENGEAAKWFAEMMNQPVAAGGSVIEASEICYAPARVPEEIEYGFITIDPAISQMKWADKSAIVAHGWVEEAQQWQSLEYVARRGMDPDDIFWTAVQMAQTWGFRVIGVETASMQQVLEHHFKYLQVQHGLMHLQFVALQTGNQRKSQRIIAWATMLKSNPEQGRVARYALTQGDFVVTQELLMYEPTKRDNDDNVIDSHAYAPQMISRWMFEIMKNTPAQNETQVTPIAQIARV